MTIFTVRYFKHLLCVRNCVGAIDIERVPALLGLAVQ